jgi:glycosyltransferase involved in cell wall biosynthesis
LERDSKELESNLIAAHKRVEQKENENNLLKQEISTIKQSITWRIFSKIQRFLAFGFPPNTRRGTFLSLVLQFLKYYKTYGATTATKMVFSFMKHGSSVNAPSIQIKSWKSSMVFNNAEIDKMKKEISEFKTKPKISIIMPVFNVDKKWLILAIDSVRNQIYENWELCIVDDASTAGHIKPILSDYAKKDPRIRTKFLQENKNIAGASNEALGLVTGEYTGLLDHDDELSVNALYEVAKSINQKSSVQIIYSDENHISTAGERIDPFFKPDYSPDLLMTCHYMVHFMVYSTSLLKKLNGFRAGFDGAQDYDLVLRAVEQTNKIHHIPKLLYGWRNIPTSTASGGSAKPYAQIAAKKALEDALKRRRISGTPEYIPELGYFKIRYNLKNKPLVSIIIATRDRPDLLSRLLSSIEKKSTYDNYEIIIVDHLGEKKETKEFLKSLKHKVVRYEKEFNISNLFNFAEKHANGQYLLTMNDDLEVISKDWIEAMLGPCQRDEVAIVGAQLIYPDASAQEGQIKGQTIQHAGVILGVGGIAGHAFRHIPYLHNGYFGLNKTIRNYSAVTGACMLVKRDVYNKVNGYDPTLKVAYNDVDFCLRVRNEGYLIVYTPYAKLYHYEGASRGIRQPSDNTQTFVNRWKNELLKRDPYYNPNLTLLREDFSFSYFGMPIQETPLAILLEIYATRPDLQKSFPEVISGNYENLIQWAATYGISSKKYGLPHDPSAHILLLYKFWYEEHSKINATIKNK